VSLILQLLSRYRRIAACYRGSVRAIAWSLITPVFLAVFTSCSGPCSRRWKCQRRGAVAVPYVINPILVATGCDHGPAAGALAAAHLGVRDRGAHVLAFHMGGTTAKLSIVDEGKPTVAYCFEVGRERRFIEGSGLPSLGAPPCRWVRAAPAGKRAPRLWHGPHDRLAPIDPSIAGSGDVRNRMPCLAWTKAEAIDPCGSGQRTFCDAAIGGRSLCQSRRVRPLLQSSEGIRPRQRGCLGRI